MYYELLRQGLRVRRDCASINLCMYARMWVYVIIFVVLTMLSVAQIKNLWFGKFLPHHTESDYWRLLFIIIIIIIIIII